MKNVIISMKKLRRKMKRRKRLYQLMVGSSKVGAVSVASIGISPLTKNVWRTKVKMKIKNEHKRIKQ